MRSIISIIVLICALVLPSSAVRAEEAHAILNRAIQAHGGESRLARTKVGRLKAKAEGAFAGAGAFNVTWEETFDLPRRYKQTIEGTVNGMAMNTESAVNGRKGWMRQGKEPPRDFSLPELLPLEQHWHTFLAQLLLLRSKDTQLTSLNEERRDGRTLVGIRVVTSRGTADLYFDKSTGLLAWARRPLLNFMGGQQMRGETVYDDYREVSGVRYPMHIKASNGDANFVNRTLSSIEFLDKIDDSVFAKPEPPQPAADMRFDIQLVPEQETVPARWDIRLILATLGVGVFVGVVWLIVRASKRREAPTPPK
ncbi:MAG TPA: hypothetical protein VN688_30860 [Gemmataceae bacterium]|nr:hypothetical protein [Gemmataceae bacterium]